MNDKQKELLPSDFVSITVTNTFRMKPDNVSFDVIKELSKKLFSTPHHTRYLVKVNGKQVFPDSEHIFQPGDSVRVFPFCD